MIEAIVGRGLKIYPPIVLILMGTGGYMFTKYANSNLGFFDTPLQILLMIKLFFVLLIVLGVIYTMYCKLTKKRACRLYELFSYLCINLRYCNCYTCKTNVCSLKRILICHIQLF